MVHEGFGKERAVSRLEVRLLVGFRREAGEMDGCLSQRHELYAADHVLIRWVFPIKTREPHE